MSSTISHSVPLTMGSPRSMSLEAGPFRVVEAWFPPKLVLEPHLHDRVTFAVMLDGSFDLRFGARSYDCPPGTVFTEPLGDKHGNRFGTQGAHVLVIQPDHHREELFRPCRHLFGEISHFRHRGLLSLAWRLALEIRRSDDVCALAAQGIGLEMMADASRLACPRGRAGPAWFSRAEELLHDRFLDRFDVDDVAEAVDVHPVHLARVFRKHRGASIGSYVRSLRLDWAVERLSRTDDSIASIALAAGFSDQSHFTRMFKRRTGVTPGRFRRAVRD